MTEERAGERTAERAEKQQTAGIIGGGIGGLFAAAFLARQGIAVTVLERAAYGGGNAGSYVRGGRTYPTGATVAFGLEEGGPLRGLLDELGIEVPAQAMEHAMDVVLPHRTIRIYEDRERWERELAAVFPERGEAVVRFWRELADIASRVRQVTGTRVAFPLNRPFQFGRLPQLAARHPIRLLALLPYTSRTVEYLLAKHSLQDYEPFRAFLDAQLVDAAQTDVRHAALLPSSLALDVYRYGAFAIQGGFGGLVRLLEARIVELGGEVLRLAPAKEITRQGRGWLVTSTNKQSFVFDHLVNATGLMWNGRELVEPEPSVETGAGAFRLDARVSAALQTADGSTMPRSRLPFAWQIVAQHSLLQAKTHGPVYVTLHPSLDLAGAEIEDERLLTVSVHVSSDSWAALDRATYAAGKTELTEALLAEVRRVLPHVNDHLLELHAGTPRTYRRFVGKAQVGGFRLTVRNAILKPRGVLGGQAGTRLHGQPPLYHAGDAVFPGPGTLSAALSGFFAARAILAAL